MKGKVIVFSYFFVSRKAHDDSCRSRSERLFAKTRLENPEKKRLDAASSAA